MMEEINIDHAVDLISSDKLKLRSDGLAGTFLSDMGWILGVRLTKLLDLKHILQQNRHTSKLYECDQLFREKMLMRVLL
jgi:hypothetical protein